jgi:hypothetical protein
MNIEESVSQPLFPRVRMIWFFVAAAAVAIALGIIRAADQGQAFAAALVVTGAFLTLTMLFFAATFVVAYLLGSIEKSLGESQMPASPFADGKLPEQILPPSPVDVN